MKKSVVAALTSRARSLLVGASLALGVTWAIASTSGCILGPKQDDPDQLPASSDTGVGGGGADTSPGPADAFSADGAASDTYDPTSGLDGCKGDGGDAAPDGDAGCDAMTDGATDGDAGDATDATDATVDGEGGGDVATGE